YLRTRNVCETASSRKCETTSPGGFAAHECVEPTQMHRFLPVLATLAFVCAAMPGAATSAPGVAYGLTDDAWLANGPGTVADRVATLDGLGVHVVRFTVRWDQVAPTQPVTPTDPQDPAYDWETTSSVLDALHTRGIDVVLQLDGSPMWANGHKP